jgi:hypothetical protein
MLFKKLLFSYESEYLKERKWCQFATFGFYKKNDLDYVLQALD